jgi:hypothetical protein
MSRRGFVYRIRETTSQSVDAAVAGRVVSPEEGHPEEIQVLGKYSFNVPDAPCFIRREARWNEGMAF